MLKLTHTLLDTCKDIGGGFYIAIYYIPNPELRGKQAWSTWQEYKPI